MIFAKELILKGVAGLAVVGSAGAGVWWYTTQKPENNTPNETNELETLVSNVGLSCTPSSGLSATNGVVCNKKESSATNIKVKRGSTDINLSNITGGSIKVYKLTASGGGTTIYNKNFKFVIEGGDIGNTPNKLEEFETYEVKEETEGGGEWKLIRKSSAKDEIKKALGLPNDCTLPDSNESGGNSCSSITSEENLKAINFKDKKEGGATFENGNNGSVTLTIKKATSTAENPFPLGYSFTFKPEQKISIKSSSDEDSLKANIDVEFKINKEGTSLSLEKAWTLDSLAKEVGLENCIENTKECSIKNGSLKVKHSETSKEEGKSKTEPSSGGKIKFYKDTAGHKEGFKFVIEDGDIDLTGSSSTISKLEEFETYEIEEDGGKYYLSRKTKAFKEISKSLSLPSGCDQLESNSTDCSNITKETLKNIKFDGKNGTDVTVENSGLTIKLKVTKLTSSDNAFPHGYKFVLESNKEITIPKSPSGNITIKKDTNTEFKLKKEKTGENISLSLEKAWNAKSLGQKVGLSCQTGETKECTLSDSGNINVNNGGSNKFQNLSKKAGEDGKKIKYEEDKEGYNQGIRFYVEGSDDICLQNGTDVSADDTNKKIENSSTSYEIKQDGGVWYLTKKSQAA